MGLWIMGPLALLAGILLWDRERLFTVEKLLAVVDILVAAPWFISMGLESGADLFADRFFQVGWYVAGLQIVIGTLALIAGWRRHGLEAIVTSRVHARGATSGATPAHEPFSWGQLVTGTMNASPWILGYGLLLAALMGWIGRTI